ncbi:MAG: tetratricopeptide repeat protein [Alcanivoracaceae bacterium]|nr:tetratricopeptide repeat protein [Alcanivoracaceae bacterium]
MKQTLVSEDLIVNQVTHQVTQNGDYLKLPDLSYRTLLLLLKKAPNAVTIDQLIDEVWQKIEVSPETVTQRIALLRKSLSANNNKVEYISSIRNQGYRWVPEIQTLYKSSKKKNSLNVKLPLLALVILFVSVMIWVYNSNKSVIHNQPIQINKIEPIQDEYLSQAWLYLNKHDLNSNQIAIELFRKSLASNPDSVDAMMGISFALSHQVTKFNQPDALLNEARELAQFAVDSHPDNANAWVALGFMYDARGDIDKAIELYEKAIHLNPKDESTRGSLAYLYSQKGRLVDAMQLNLLVLGNKLPYLNLQIANTLELLGFDSVAETWYQKADELSPDNVFATHQRARYYISHDQNSKAKLVVESALNRGIRRPELYVILGILEWINRDLDQADLNFKKALEVDATDFEGNLWSFIAAKNVEKTIGDQQKFEQLWFKESSNWPNVDVFQALYLAHNNRFDESIRSIEKAYKKGYLNHRWLKKLPPFNPILNHPKFLKIIEHMQNDISNQRQQLLEADWLPISFLDPQKY